MFAENKLLMNYQVQESNVEKKWQELLHYLVEDSYIEALENLNNDDIPNYNDKNKTEGQKERYEEVKEIIGHLDISRIELLDRLMFFGSLQMKGDLFLLAVKLMKSRNPVDPSKKFRNIMDMLIEKVYLEHEDIRVEGNLLIPI